MSPSRCPKEAARAAEQRRMAAAKKRATSSPPDLGAARRLADAVLRVDTRGHEDAGEGQGEELLQGWWPRRSLALQFEGARPGVILRSRWEKSPARALAQDDEGALLVPTPTVATTPGAMAQDLSVAAEMGKGPSPEALLTDLSTAASSSERSVGQTASERVREAASSSHRESKEVEIEAVVRRAVSHLSSWWSGELALVRQGFDEDLRKSREAMEEQFQNWQSWICSASALDHEQQLGKRQNASTTALPHWSLQEDPRLPEALREVQQLRVQLASAQKERLAELRIVCAQLQRHDAQLNALSESLQQQTRAAEEWRLRCSEAQAALHAELQGKVPASDLEATTKGMGAWVEQAHHALCAWCEEAQHMTSDKLHSMRSDATDQALQLQEQKECLKQLHAWCREVDVRERGLSHMIEHLVEHGSPELTELLEEALHLPLRSSVSLEEDESSDDGGVVHAASTLAAWRQGRHALFARLTCRRRAGT